MLARLFSLVFVVMLGWLLGRLIGGVRRVRKTPRPRAGAAPGGGKMVRDRICNTFLPSSLALRTTVHGHEYFFCSEDCRRRFLDRSAAARPRPGPA